MSDNDTFSTYDAKSRFSEVLRRVREGRTVTVTYQGAPVAEIRPLDRSGGTSARMEWLRGRGVVIAPENKARKLAPIARRPGAYDALVSSNLLEAELRCALRREGVEGGDDLLAALGWILPDRRLTAEMERVLAVRPLRGADLSHVATALYLAESPGDVDFLTLDVAQRETAAAVGFPTPV